MYGSGVSAGGGSGGGSGPSPRATGWAAYEDTEYTTASPLTLATGTRIALPNNAGSVNESQLPEDMVTFYDEGTNRIFSTVGSDFIITVRLKARPLNEVATWFKLELQTGIGGDSEVIEIQQQTFPWGVLQDNVVNLTFSGFALTAFANSGAYLFVTADGPVEIYDISYVIKRTHKGV